jgi:hypothetical protein
VGGSAKLKKLLTKAILDNRMLKIECGKRRRRLCRSHGARPFQKAGGSINRLALAWRQSIALKKREKTSAKLPAARSEHFFPEFIHLISPFSFIMHTIAWLTIA